MQKDDKEKQVVLPDATDETSNGKKHLDSVDRQIILQLAEDGRRSYRQIARNIDLSEGTVRQRANQLIADGYIRIAAVGNAMRLGVQVIAISLLKVAPASINDAAKILAAFSNVRFVGLSFGSADIIIQTLHTSQRDLHHFLTIELPGSIPELKDVETFQLADVAKSTWDLATWLNIAGQSK